MGGDGRGGNGHEKWVGQGMHGDAREERARGGEGSVRWTWEGKGREERSGEEGRERRGRRSARRTIFPWGGLAG